MFQNHWTLASVLILGVSRSFGKWVTESVILLTSCLTLSFLILYGMSMFHHTPLTTWDEFLHRILGCERLKP